MWDVQTAGILVVKNYISYRFGLIGVCCTTFDERGERTQQNHQCMFWSCLFYVAIASASPFPQVLVFVATASCDYECGGFLCWHDVFTFIQLSSSYWNRELLMGSYRRFRSRNFMDQLAFFSGSISLLHSNPDIGYE